MSETLTVTSVEYLDEEEDVYDLRVEYDHSYLLGIGVYSHNTDLAANLALNQARMGAKISLTSLEMSKLQMDQRMMAIITAIPLQQIRRKHDMDRAMQHILVDAFKQLHNQIKSNGGRLTIYAPDDDVSIEEVLTMLRSRGYDNNIVDYVGLLKGLDGDDQWRKLGSVLRYAHRFANIDKSVATILAQLDDEGRIRYSRAMQEHAALMWKWQRPDDSGVMTIKQPKARNLKSFDFSLQMDFSNHRITDVDLSQVTETPTRGVRKISNARRKKEDFQL